MINRDIIRALVIEAIIDKDKLTKVVDELCDLHNINDRSDLTKFINALDNKETEIGGGEGVIRAELDDLFFTYQVSWGPPDDETTINSIDYTNVVIKDKEGENEIILILEETDFDVAFQEHIIDNFYLIKPKI